MKSRNKKKQSGFTLIELLVVIILVTILAAVGIPLLTANVERAKLTEADAGLSMLKTGMRAYLAEHGKYVDTAGAAPTFPAIGIKLKDTTVTPPTPGDLDGRYFVTAAYAIQAADPTKFCTRVDGSDAGNADAPQAPDVATLKRSMNEKGNIYNSIDCSGTCINC